MRGDFADQFSGSDAEPTERIGRVTPTDVAAVAAVVRGNEAVAAPEAGQDADHVLVRDPVFGIVAVVAAHSVVVFADGDHPVQHARAVAAGIERDVELFEPSRRFLDEDIVPLSPEHRAHTPPARGADVGADLV